MQILMVEQRTSYQLHKIMLAWSIRHMYDVRGYMRNRKKCKSGMPCYMTWIQIYNLMLAYCAPYR